LPDGFGTKIVSVPTAAFRDPGSPDSTMASPYVPHTNEKPCAGAVAPSLSFTICPFPCDHTETNSVTLEHCRVEQPGTNDLYAELLLKEEGEQKKL
jgi:hypothetical protein